MIFDREEKLEIAAKVFWLNNYGHLNYPHKTWKEQRDEMRGIVNDEFLDFVVKGVRSIKVLNREIEAAQRIN